MGVIREKLVKNGKWRTMEWFLNAKGVVFFKDPKGASIKVRYGVGWLGKDRQKQKLDGKNYKKVKVGRWSLTKARVQIKLLEDSRVIYSVDGYGAAFPEINF